MICPRCHTKNAEDSHFCRNCAEPLKSKPRQSPTATAKYPAEKKIKRGFLLTERYEIIEELGEGGMGRVYKAHDLRLDEDIALKILHPEIASSKKTIERFRNELKLARKIAHRNICHMYDLYEENGIPFITMEYVEGEDLKRSIHRVGPISVGKIVRIAEQICEGLTEAHRIGVVHRDLKPQNIMIDAEGMVRIMDFGIARSISAEGLTADGVIIGTPEYMAPEQLEGSATDSRSDIYSLGVILFEMATGRLPFSGDTPLSIALKHKTEPPAEPRAVNPQIPDPLNRLILKCMAKNIHDRYASSSALLNELKELKKQFPASGKMLPESKNIITGVLGSLKEKKIIETVAAFVGGGVALLEFEYHILIHHYHFPEETVDMTAVTLSGALICTLIWQWFRRGRPPPRRLKMELLLIPPIVLCVLGINLLIMKEHIFSSPSRSYAIAVLPVSPISEDVEDQAFANGIQEFISLKLRQVEHLIPELWMVPVDKIRQYSIQSAADAKNKFALTHAVSGRLRRLENQYRLTLNLIDTENLMSAALPLSVNEPLSNLSAWQDETPERIIKNLRFPVTEQIKAAISRGNTSSPQAFKACIMGMGFMGLPQLPDSQKQALHYLNRSVALDPEYLPASCKLAELMWRQSQSLQDSPLAEQAEKICSQALEKKPDYAPLRLLLADIFRSTDRLKEAEDLLSNTDTQSFSYSLLNDLAWTYELNDKFAEAEKTYKEAIALKPGYWLGYNYLGFFYYSKGQTDQAVEYFKKVTEITPENEDAFANLGVVYFDSEQIDLAQAMFEKSSHIRPNYQACSNLGTLYYFNGNYEEAVTCFIQALQFDPKMPTLWENLGDSYAQIPGKEKQREEAYQKALGLARSRLKNDPADIKMQAVMASIRASSGRHEEAAQEITAIINKAPTDVPLLLRGIRIYEISGERDKAVQALRDYMRLNGPRIFIEKTPELVSLRSDPRCRPYFEKKESGKQP